MLKPLSNYSYIGKSSSPDIIYYNLQIVNNTESNNGLDPAIRFNETRASAIVPSPANDYEFSVVRFAVSATGDLPLFVPKIQLGQSDINLTTYAFTILGYNGDVAYYQTKYIEYSPETLNAQLPKPPLVGQDLLTDYYYVYTYSHFINLINAQMATAMATVVSSLGDTDANPPVISWNPSTKLFSIYLQQNKFINQTVDQPFYLLFFNPALNGLLNNFSSTFTYGGYVNPTFGVTIPEATTQIVGYDVLGTNTYTDSGTIYTILTQDWESVSKIWTPIESIVFSSALLPINSEQISEPLFFTSESNVSNVSTSSSANSPIITDITIEGGAEQWKTGILYVPSGEYRIESIIGETEIRQVDIQVYWKCRYDGQLYPLTMPPNSSASMKMMFRRKK